MAIQYGVMCASSEVRQIRENLGSKDSKELVSVLAEARFIVDLQSEVSTVRRWCTGSLHHYHQLNIRLPPRSPAVDNFPK